MSNNPGGEETSFIEKATSGFITLYLIIAFFIFTPYYNYKYIATYGFGEWLFAGEVVPTMKALFWPYFVFFNHSGKDKANQVANNAKEKELESPNENEWQQFREAIDKLSEADFSDTDLNKLRTMMNGYTKRINRSLTEKEYNELINTLDVTVEFSEEMCKSLLLSWDKREYTTTNRFDELFPKMEKQSEKGKEDSANYVTLLKLAAANKTSIQSGDKKLPFNRTEILTWMGRNTIMRSNLEKIKTVMKEFTR